MASKGFLVEIDFVHDENSLVKYVKEKPFRLNRDTDIPGYRFRGTSEDGVEVIVLYTSVGPMVDVKFAKKLYTLSSELAARVEAVLRTYLSDSQIQEIEKYSAEKVADRKARLVRQPRLRWLVSEQEGEECLYCGKNLSVACVSPAGVFTHKREEASWGNDETV